MSGLSQFEKNRNRTWSYFQRLGMIPADATKQTWVLHHIDETMKHLDPERYALWRPQDVWPLPVPVHRAYHNRMTHSGKKLSETHRERFVAAGRAWREEHPEEWSRRVSESQKGRVQSKETRERISQTKKEAYVKNEHPNYNGEIHAAAGDICRKYVDGSSTVALSREYSCTPNLICSILEENGVPRRSPSKRSPRWQNNHHSII